MFVYFAFRDLIFGFLMYKGVKLDVITVYIKLDVCIITGNYTRKSSM